ncbi:MAG: hypothetical protein M8354_12610 [Halalkalicoccus sp.]|nr:hypothetical protein [Halalkalicoccus sp.]
MIAIGCLFIDHEELLPATFRLLDLLFSEFIEEIDIEQIAGFQFCCAYFIT